MGNQREIRQVSPRAGLGVAIPIRGGHSAAVNDVLGDPDECNRFYIYFQPSGQPIECHNMAGDEDIVLDPQAQDYIVIQSGGKMWCGYEAFVERVRCVAPHLDDARFYVGDELDYIDEFQITNGVLHYHRVHAGYWKKVEWYLEEIEGLAGEQIDLPS